MYYIEKVAKEVKKEKKKKDYNKYLGVAGGATVANTGGLGALHLLSESKLNSLTDKEIDELVKEKAKDIGYRDSDAIQIERFKRNVESGANVQPFSRPRIGIKDDEFIIRHELGHIKDFSRRNNKKYKGAHSRFVNDVVELDKLTGNGRMLIPKNQALHEKYRNEAAAYVLNEIKRGSTKALSNAGVSSLHSKAVRDKIRQTNNGKSKIVDKTMDALDNPYAATAILGGVNSAGKLRDEFMASADASKDMIRKYGIKKGLVKSAPIFALQMGSYLSASAAAEALKGGGIRLTEDMIKRKRANKDKQSDGGK